MSQLPGDWAQWRAELSPAEYDERFQRLARSGQNVHGEADFVGRYHPASVLDGGCGTGRVGIELARRGVRVVGVDADPEMVSAAAAKAPRLDWRCVDLAELSTQPDLLEAFDMVLLAGNVVPYVPAEHRALAVRECARILVPGGRLVAGFTLRPDWPSVGDYDAWCADGGLVLEDRFSSWDGDPYTGGDYSVSVHSRPGPAD